jgi:hypothetical protein
MYFTTSTSFLGACVTVFEVEQLIKNAPETTNTKIFFIFD